MNQLEKTISNLQAEINSAVYMDNSYKDCVPVSILQDAVEQLSDPDRVKVVRCRDCRYWKPPSKEEIEDGCTYGRCSDTGAGCDAIDFCSSGERE